MNIGIVTFYGAKENMGGGFTPALALQEWCNVFEYDSDVVAFVGVDIVNFDLSKGIDRIVHHEEKLNEYDRLFFITLPIFYKFDISKIKTKFDFMMHGEGDPKLYENYFFDFKQSPCFNEIIDITNNSGHNFWYPCIMPYKLISNPGIEQPRVERRKILYASRITNWLNPHMFANLAERFGGAMYGQSHNEMTRSEVRSMADRNMFDLHEGIFDRSEIDLTGFRYFWDCAGTDDKPFYKKRISLSAWESLRDGLVPIVFDDQCPDSLVDVCVTIPRHANVATMINQIEIFESTATETLSIFNEQMMVLSVYDKVLAQIETILSNLINPNYVYTKLEPPCDGKVNTALDEQVGGDHYKKFKIQPVEFSYHNNIPALESQIIKYIFRHKFKNGAEDLNKAKHLIDVLLELEYTDD